MEEIAMKKNIRNTKTRLCSMMLTVCMIFGLLPMPIIAHAEGTDPVCVTWIPQKQTGSGERQVMLTVDSTKWEEGFAAAIIDISLDSNEAEALQWAGDPVDESALGSQDPEVPPPHDSDSSQSQPDQTEPEQAEETEEPQTMAQVITFTAGPQAILIRKDNGGGAVLRILLSGNEPYTGTLTFAASSDVEIDVAQEDIKVQTYEAGNVPESITAVTLLTNSNSAASIIASPFTVFAYIPEEIAVSTNSETVDLGGSSKNIAYTIKLQKIVAEDDGKDYTFTVTLPDGLSLPAGALSYSNGSIRCGSTEIAKLVYPTDTAGFSVDELTLVESGKGFTFIVKAPADANATEADVYDITLTLDGGELIRSAEAISGNVTLTVSAADAQSKSASVAVTAGDATLPGEGGWNVTVTKRENKNQNVFWRDNEAQSARPAGWADRSFWEKEVELYYTLTDQSGVTYAPTLLEEDTLKFVGLDAYPTFAAYGTHSFTVKDLPTQLKQTDPNDPGTVVNEYTVSWSLEPPENVDGYSFRNIQSDEVGPSGTYPSITTGGWYYMQEDTFTFTLDIRQGDENPLVEDSESKLRALLKNFQFNWSYSNKTGNDTIQNMIQAGNATLHYDHGRVIITGLWKYNVDGSPINYSVTKISDDTSEDKITADELGSETGLLEEDEWYQIQYVNTGIPGEGQDTTALHNGGTLQLVRQGTIHYEATKIWLDSYGDEEGSGRPNVSFILYRYRKGEDPGTAAQLTGYSVQLTKEMDQEGNPTGGYVVKVMTERGDDATLADLPKYDTLDGAEFIYVVRETLSGPNAGQYEQVFGTVTVNETTGEIEKTEESLPVGTLPGESTVRPSGNTYLYNGGTLTNYQTGTVPVSATKTWSAAAYQSQFDDVTVELTLQYQVKGSGNWQTYYTDGGETVQRYLHRFYAESLSDTLTARPSMPRYQTTTLDASNKELEYRWLETTVYKSAPNSTETALGDATGKLDILYPADGVNSAAGDNPVGSFTMNGSRYTVTYTGSAANSTQITNAVSEYLDYEVIKEWHADSEPKEITLQILRSVAGGEFKNYLEFTMEVNDGAETVTVNQTLPEDNGIPDGASPEFKIQEGSVVKDDDSSTTLKETWNALVSGLPRFDERGRPYEYLLLESNAFPSYRTEILNNGNYQTTVINGGGGEGFNLLVRKVWLDDGDMEHREPVTLTLYNKNNNEPVTLSETNDTPYTIILGGEGEETLWHKVVWIDTTGLGNRVTDTGDTTFDADDVYLVETEVGTDLVNHHLENNNNRYTYDYIYQERGEGEPIFEVTTDHHRYQVTYQQETVTESNGIDASFTITNRRLGNIDLTVTKTWVDGREGDTSQVLNQMKTVLEQYAQDPSDPTYLALAFRLVFDDSMGKTESGTDEDGWEITYSGPSVHSDTVCVGGEDAQIYRTYEKDDQPGAGYMDTGSSEWVILGYVKNAEGQWEIQTSDSASFLGLPKYDTAGEVVAYSVEEVWLDVTQAGVSADGKITPPKVVDFTDANTRKQYSDLYELWKDFSADYQWGDYIPDVDGSHTRDEQTLEVTNARRGSKTVQWTVEWQDAFASNSNLRPDIYLDLYQVTYTYDEEGHATPVISRVTGRTIVWNMDNPKEWTATLSGVPAFDEKGNEIFYYAVQRTVMAAGDYDYQVALYEMNDVPLGTRDDPQEHVETLNGTTTSITNANGDPYDLAVLGTRDETDSLTSIQWSGDQPTNIGRFGEANNYPKYALLEGGTIINTLAETYSIEGVKYWTNLPTGWETGTRLPQVTFAVYREIPGETGSKEYVASVTITSDLWEELKNGTQYKYLVQYEGINVLGKESADENKNGINGEVYVKAVYDLQDTDFSDPLTDPTLLSRYRAGTGDLWTYTVEETIDWGADKPDDGHQIFDDAPGGIGFTFTNNYKPTQGSIQVKKFLYLPMTTTAEGDSVPESYPAVTFRLERWLQNADGSSYAKDGWYQDITLTSDQVQSIWNNTTGTVATGENLVASGKRDTGDAYIWATLKFDDLPLYAPDGTRYQYSVSERKSWLQGYDTWGVKGDVTDSDSDTWGQALETSGEYTEAITGLEPTVNDTTVDATFKNQRTNPQKELELLAATKIWEDNDSAFRPKTEAFAALLTLTRTAAQQGGTGGAVAITQELTQGEDYTISVDPADGDASSWTITITPADGKSFEKYAPNGMPWTYTLKERVSNGRLQITQSGGTDQDKIYTPSTPNNKANGEWQNTITGTTQPVSGSNPATYSFGSLTNSIMTLAKFQKNWVDAEGNPITQDYLGFDLTVEFQLQVRKMKSNDPWVNAGDWTYDNGKTLGLAEGADVHSLTGRVVGAAHNWTYTFEDLPGVVQDSNGIYLFLEYRVIETKVSWDNGEQTISWNVQTDQYQDPVNGPITDATFSCSNNTSTTTNKLATTSVSVTKVWDDNDNQYGTRPGADGPWSWASWFVLQRSTDHANWENVAVFEKLYGNNAESKDDPAASGKWEDTITGLPTMDYQESKPYTYRVRELQPKADGYTLNDVNAERIVEPGGTYNPNGFNYTTSYDEPSVADNLWTVSNSMDTPTGEVPKNVVAIKDWVGADGNGTVGSVTFQLEYSYSNATGETIWGLTDFLSGSQWKKTANAGNNWTVSWNDLPETDKAGNAVTGYRVAEEAGSGWVQIEEPVITHDDATGTTTYSYTFANSITTSYSVEKVWQPSTPVGASVILGLYRTTDAAQVGSTSGTPVPVHELAVDGTKRTVTLDGTTDATETTAWRATFTNLPKYNASGDLYYYYALELDGSSNPIAQNGKITLNTADYEVSYSWATDNTTTTVTNTTATSLTGTKIWKDNSNAYSTRPDSLALILQRKVEGGNWVDVSALYTPVWSKNGNAWTYTFTGLPTCDKNGNVYTYQVREVVPAGYTQQGGTVNSFTNVLSGTVTIAGQKNWSGGVGTTPILTLERRLADQTPEASWNAVSATPVWSKPEGSSTWTFTYTGLDKYDTNGVLYEYRVREVEPDGYEAGYKTGTVAAATPGHPVTTVDGLTITNYKDGSLTVSKTVSGNRGDQTKAFTFTVTLTGNSSAGTAAESINGSFTANRTNADGTTRSDTITFTGGVSAEFTLKHNESLTIQGLPAGIGYQVAEAEADQGGYSTSGTRWTGSIPAGGTVEAKFNNYNHSSGGGGDSGRMNLTGKKIWVDKGQNDPNRPVDITLELYRKVAGGEEERAYAQLTWVKNGNTWTYTFHNLPREDENGNKYIYRVSEVVPDGYTSSQSGNNITNRSSEVEPGSLIVSKQVTGSGGNPAQEFTFTVTLSNRNLTGTYGQMTFVNGVATFTLRDGESLRADNLPAGTTYTVTEKEADQNGYTTTASGGAGTIVADATVSASFVNHRPGSNPDPGPGPDPNPGPAPDPDLPDIPDTPDTPDQPENPDHLDNPEGADVQTGDQGKLALYGALTILFAAGLATVLYLGRPSRQPKGGKRSRQ